MYQEKYEYKFDRQQYHSFYIIRYVLRQIIYNKRKKHHQKE